MKGVKKELPKLRNRLVLEKGCFKLMLSGKSQLLYLDGNHTDLHIHRPGQGRHLHCFPGRKT